MADRLTAVKAHLRSENRWTWVKEIEDTEADLREAEAQQQRATIALREAQAERTTMTNRLTKIEVSLRQAQTTSDRNPGEDSWLSGYRSDVGWLVAALREAEARYNDLAEAARALCHAIEADGALADGEDEVLVLRKLAAVPEGDRPRGMGMDPASVDPAGGQQ